MSKVKYISKESMKQRKELLRIQRNECIQCCDYDKAKQILKEIQELNRKIYYSAS